MNIMYCDRCYQRAETTEELDAKCHCARDCTLMLVVLLFAIAAWGTFIAWLAW